MLPGLSGIQVGKARHDRHVLATHPRPHATAEDIPRRAYGKGVGAALFLREWEDDKPTR